MTDEFTDIEGINVSRADLVQRKINYYKEAFGEGNTQITDFNEGSEARNFLESVSIDTYELRYLIDFMMKTAFPQHSIGGYLDMLGVLVNCYRVQAIKSTGTVTFTTPASKAYNITIPAGTILETEGPDNVEFQTTEAGIITAGNLTVDVAAEAVNAGTDGNVTSNTITIISDPIDDLTVNNTSAFTGGTEEETDDDYRERIIDAGQGGIIGTEQWFKSSSEGVEGVHDAAIISNPLGESFSVQVLINGDTKPTPDEVITAVEDLLESEDYKVAGLEIGVDKPTFTTQNIAGTITLTDGYVWEDVESDLEDNIECYFNGGTTTNGVTYPGLDIGDDIIRTQLMQIIANTTGVLDYSVTTPAANVTIPADGAAQLGTITLTEV